MGDEVKALVTYNVSAWQLWRMVPLTLPPIECLKHVMTVPVRNFSFEIDDPDMAIVTQPSVVEDGAVAVAY
jgi:hypothetical protein